MLTPPLMPVIQKLGQAAAALALVSLGLLCGCMEPGPRALLKGDALLREGKYPEALDHLQHAVRLLPKNAPAQNLLGLASHRLGRIEQAEACYRQAIHLDQNLASARFNLGCLFLEKGELPAAIDQLMSYTYLQPSVPGGWLKLASAQLRARRLDQAEKSFRSALALDQRLPEAWNGLGTIQVQRRQSQEAQASFNQALTHSPNYAPALLNAAIVSHQSLNNRSAALQLYRRYLALSPRPANWDAVNATAAQLDSELHPPQLALVPVHAPPPTNQLTPVSQVTPPTPPTPPKPSNQIAKLTPPVASPPPATQSNVPKASPLLSHAPLVLTPPKPLVTAPIIVTSPPITLTSTSAPLPEIEVARVDEDLVLKPTKDEDIVPATAPSTDSTPAAEPEEISKPLPVAPATAPEPSPSIAEPKKPWLARLNPFRSKPRSTPNQVKMIPAAPASLASGKTADVQEVAPASVAPPPAPPPPAPKRTYPRYTYSGPGKIAPGNRSKAEQHFSSGIAAQRTGKLELARDHYENAIKDDPAYFEAHYNLGVAALELREFKSSLTAFENALALKPESTDARYNFALALKQARFMHDAAAELETVLKERPNEVRALFSLANLYAYQLQEPSRARELFLKVLELDPQYPQATEIRYWLAASGRTDQSTQ